MPRKSLLLLALLALLPLVIFAWLGWRVARAEDARVEQGYRRLLTQRLMQESEKLTSYFDSVRRDLSSETQARVDWPEALRDLTWTHPLVRQAIVLDREGQLVHPRLDQTSSRSEREFIKEIAPLIRDKDFVRVAFGLHPANRQSAVEPLPKRGTASLDNAEFEQRHNNDRRLDDTNSQGEVQASSASDGWYLWYWGRGLNLIYWHRWREDRLTVVALSRPRWMADVLGLLPDTERDSRHPEESADWCIGLVDAAEQMIYQWGPLDPPRSARPIVELAADAPLGSWRLKYYVEDQFYRGYSHFPIMSGLVGMAAGILGLAIVLYRDYAHDMREARQRVNFVNQVSHELKTPLTNIRMYADLLGNDLDQLSDEATRRPRSRLDIIQSESKRLSRLISNVLMFARSERNRITVRPRPIQLDELVLDVVDRFAPALAAQFIESEFDLKVSRTVMLDPEIVEQIVGNLISNVARYAPEGKWLRVATRDADTRVIVEVSDHGPGIPEDLRQKVFEPFFRATDRLSDVHGTGIGLAIASRLSLAHGGKIAYIPSESGATFRVELSVEMPHDVVREET